MFPTLASVQPSVQRPAPRPVLDRLAAEHLAIAGVLDRFDRALVHLIRGTMSQPPPELPGPRKSAPWQPNSARFCWSHLAYEQDEPAEGLALMPGSI